MADEVGAATLRRLRSVVRGEVIGPQDGLYDAARSVFLRGMDRRPVAVARPVDAADVARVIDVARTEGLTLSVRGGGHSVAGHGVAEGGVVLDLSAMRGLELDVAGRSAWAQTGLNSAEYTWAAGEHGLATGFGDAATVGIGGITLGGGVGYLHRRHGLTIDNLLAAEVVTADGRVLHADEDTHPDLFWAIRGGGGNFGVATRFRYRLVEVRNVVGGMLILPATPSLLARFIAEAEAAPDALGGMINVTIAPPLPFLPPAAHGTPIVMAALVYAGDADGGARAFAPFRALATPLADFIAPCTYSAMFVGPEPPHPAAMTVRSLFMDGLNEDDAARVLDALRASTAAMRVAQFRVLGGAVAAVPVDATAFAHRRRRLMATIAAMSYDGNDGAAERAAWTGGVAAALRRGEPGAYIGFLGEDGEARVREAYPGPTWDRLRTVKAKYDPANVFRMNHNVPPAKS